MGMVVPPPPLGSPSWTHGKGVYEPGGASDAEQAQAAQVEQVKQVDQSCQSPEESLHDEGARLGEMKDYLKRKREETLTAQAQKRSKIKAMKKKEANDPGRPKLEARLGFAKSSEGLG